MDIIIRHSSSMVKAQTLVSVLFASTLLASISTYSFAADEGEKAEKEFEEVIVTGSRTGKALNKIPGAVSIISQAEIEHDVSLTADLTAMLSRTVPGYGISKQQMDRRGETLRGRVALRLLDGVPQGSPLRDGSRDSIFTDMGIISRVEVVNGSSSTEGIGASGGIINYITKTPTKMGLEAQISSQYRSQFKTDSDSWRVAMNIAYKADKYDVLVAGSFAETGISYDGEGKTIGLGASGSDRDSKSNNLFIKIGTNFGEDDSQRIEISHSRFILECQCNYSTEILHPEIWDYHERFKIPIHAIKQQPLGAMASFNDFKQTTLTYTNNDLFGGALQIQIYDADQAMRFEAEIAGSKQDPLFAPVGTLLEQSEIKSKKKGLRSSWNTDALFGNDGLGLQIGADIVEDIAQQRFALTGRSWVPPMKYTSFAPFMQLSLDIDALTFTGGLRREDGNLRVDDFTTTWFRKRKSVNGGDIGYGEWLPNAGAIWRVNNQWSVYASYSKGFTLPNAGFALRKLTCNTAPKVEGCPNDTPTSVNDVYALEAIIILSKEIGFSWSGEDGKFGVSIYESTSDLGDGVKVVDGEFALDRSPQKIQGIEVTGAYDVTDELNLSAIYASITGKKGPSKNDLNREIGVLNINPNKLIVTANWQFSEDGNVILGSQTIFNRDINVGKSGEEHIKGSTLFNLAINYQVGDGTLSLGIDNLLDKTYLLPQSQITFWRNYLLGRGREVSLGYTVKY
ncbi:MAG: TonB-dependent receptor [Alphaproteobacteria bacterium]|nr:MAG: TonB-dependent receptor [Alphaproteobacteria bacterium]